jgi:membrane protease YdiL (CAAX protease family)
MRQVLASSAVRQTALLVPLAAATVLPGAGTLAAAVAVAALLWVFPDARKATFAHGPWLRSIGLGVLWGLGIALVAGLVLDQLVAAMFGSAPDVSSFDGAEGDLGAYLRLLALGLLAGGILEEIIFRGFVLGWGSALFGPKAGLPLVVVSAAVFGYSHLYQGWPGVVSTGVIGLGYGLTYLATGRNLLAAIAAHMTINVIGATEIYLGL